MSEIRTLIANAQEAERRGEKNEAARLLREAATYYRDRDQLRRAAQMLRHARRVEGVPEDDEEVFGFEAPEGKVLVEQRTPQLADPSIDAWCSFCCKPKAEVGPLVAGPAGSFICAGCTAISAALRQPGVGGEAGPTWTISAPKHELPTQRRARERLTRLRSRLTLVIGPTGSGKSTWLASLGTVTVIDATSPLSPTVSPRSPGEGGTFLHVTADVPPPALVLQGESGPEPIHDTASLTAALPHLAPALLQQVDAVFAFEAPDVGALTDLARALATARAITLPDAALTQLVSLAHRSGRGAHELVALLARIPSGSYQP